MNETENADTGTDIEDKEEEQVIKGSYLECAQMKEDTEQLSDRDIGSMSSWARIMDDQEECQSILDHYISFIYELLYYVNCKLLRYTFIFGSSVFRLDFLCF